MFLYLFFSVEDFSIKNYILKKFIFSEKLLIVSLAIIIIMLYAMDKKVLVQYWNFRISGRVLQKTKGNR